MRVSVITPPDPVVTWEEADAHLKLDGDVEQRVLVEAMVSAATAHIDGPDGWLGRAIGVQTLEARCDVFRDAMALPYGPLIDIVSVKYLDAAGVEITVPSADYEVRGWLIGSAFGRRWPSVAAHGEAVRIRYRAGYQILPPAIRAAILLMTGDLYKFRETTVTGVSATGVVLSAGVQALLTPFRVWS